MKYLQVSIALLIVTLLGAGDAEASRYLPVPVALQQIEPPVFSAVELLSAPAADAATAPPFRLDLAGSLLLLAANQSAEVTEGEGITRGDRYSLELASRLWMWPPEGVQGGECTSGCFSSEIGGNFKHQKVVSWGSHLGWVWISYWAEGADCSSKRAKGEFDGGPPSVAQGQSTQLYDVLASFFLPAGTAAFEPHLEEAFTGRLDIAAAER